MKIVKEGVTPAMPVGEFIELNKNHMVATMESVYRNEFIDEKLTVKEILFPEEV